MEPNEYIGVLEELFKILRDKIITRLGSYLTEEKKAKLYSIELDKAFVLNEELGSKIVSYDRQSSQFKVAYKFLTKDYIDRTKLKGWDFNLTELQGKLEAESPDILSEELIVFSGELNIKEKDIVKSLLIQEMIKIMFEEAREAKHQVIIDGAIELAAHEIGHENAFIVSTPLRFHDNLKVALELKAEFGDWLLKSAFSEGLEKLLKAISNTQIESKINEQTYNREIIQSTQNLDEVVEVISEQAQALDQTQSFYDSKILQNTPQAPQGPAPAPQPTIAKEITPMPSVTPKPETVSSLSKAEQDEFNNLSEKFKQNSNSLTTKELEKMNAYIKKEEKISETPVKLNSKGKSKIFRMILIVVLTVIVGIFLGWLLFKVLR